MNTETGRLLRERDWSKTALGPIEHWPQCLKMAVSLVMETRFPMVLLWGPERIQLYNDAYLPLYGRKHPSAFGQPCAESWSEVWDLIGPMLASVERTGQATWMENLRLLLDKRGHPEECFVTFSYSPVRDDSGRVVGILSTVLETTEGVLALRRQNVLQQMARAVPRTDSEEEALRSCSAPLAEAVHDLPCAAIYLRKAGEDPLQRVASHHCERHGITVPDTLSLGGTLPWPIDEVLGGGEPVRANDVLLLPIRTPGQDEIQGVFLAGLSPERPLDEALRYFLSEVAAHLGTAIGGARALQKLVEERIAVLDRMNDMFYALDRAWRVTYANAAAQKYLGIAPKDFIGRPIAESVPGFRESEIFKRFEQAMREQVPVHFETGGFVRPGWREIHAYPSPEGLSVFFRDVTVQREAQAAEARLTEIIEATSDLVATCTPTGELLYLNRAGRRLLRRKEEGLPDIDMHALFGDNLRAAIAEARANGTWSGESTLTPNGGDPIPVSLVVVAHEVKGTKAPFISVVARDIRAWLHAEDQLRESERRYRRVFQNSPLPMWLYDPDSLAFLAVNDAAVERYGYSREAFLGMRISDIRPREEVSKLVAALARKRSTGELRGLYVHRYADGSLHQVEVSSSHVNFEGATCALVVANEVTDRLTAEARLREALEFTSTLIRTAPVAIIACDTELRVTSWNPTAERVFGWSEQEVLGRPLPWAPDVKVFDRDEALDGLEVELDRRDGSVADVSVSTALIRDEGGRITGRVAFISDVSDRKRLEEQFRHSQKMEAVGQLAGGIAHDFNNLLAVILSNVRFALEELPPGTDVHEAVLDASDAATRSISLTRQLLTFSRRQVVQLEVLDLNQVVVDADRMLRRMVREDITFTTELAPLPLLVRADRGQLEQILVNLVVNARDAMPEGGALRIATSILEDSFGRQVRLLVQDTGHGMAEETRQRIFEPFFTTKGLGKGTGLGLATVYGIVKQLGGSIDVESASGRGATFTIVLPATTSSLSPEPNADEQPRPRGRTETVLLVEDEAAVRTAIGRILLRSGYQVIEAEDGIEALALLEERREPVDLVLTDLVMPRLGGRDLFARLRERHPTLPVVVMTGYDPEAFKHPAGEDSRVDLQKPFSPSELLERLRRALEVNRT